MKAPDYYRINYKRLIELLNPLAVRKHFFLVLFWSCIRPVALLYEKMKKAVDSFYEQYRYNATVISLEKLLNDRFDPGKNGIELTDHEMVISSTLYNKDEATPSMVLRERGENPATTTLFTEEECKSAHYFRLVFPAWMNPELLTEEENTLTEEEKELLKSEKKKRIENAEKLLAAYVPLGVKFITEIQK